MRVVVITVSMTVVFLVGCQRDAVGPSSKREKEATTYPAHSTRSGNASHVFAQTLVEDLGSALNGGHVAIDGASGNGASSGLAVDAYLTNHQNTEISLSISLKRPMFMRNRGRGQNMIVTKVYLHSGAYQADGLRSFISLQPKVHTPVQFVAYCFDFDKDNPSKTEEFTHDALPINVLPVLQSISTYESSHPNEDVTIAGQVAIWLAQGVSIEDIRTKFEVNHDQEVLAREFLNGSLDGRTLRWTRAADEAGFEIIVSWRRPRYRCRSPYRREVLMISRSQIAWLAVVGCVTVALLFIASTPCHADYCYAATELSWEWLTDASRAIVAGRVTATSDIGFEMAVERVLKCRGLKIDPGQVVRAPVLGRSQLIAHYQGLLLEVGWPSLLDPTTYPVHGEIRDTPWRPTFRREPTWAGGDRCLIFFGSDLQSPLQIINLDRPATIAVPFLAVDMLGQVVTKAEDLLDRIATRVAARTDEFGQPWVRSAAVSHWPPNSCIDGQDYYFVLAPPERMLWKAEIHVPPTPPRTRTIWYPANGEMGDPSMLSQAVGYWFLSGRSTKEFAADADEERDAAVQNMFQSYRFHANDTNRLTGPNAAQVGVSDFCRYNIYRNNRTNYRTYPLGWLCVWSYDQKHMAYLDGYTLRVYTVDAQAKGADRLVVTQRDVHRARSYVEFSPDGRTLAYTTEDNSVCLVDLQQRRLIWTAQAPFPKANRPTRTVCLEFSHDHRYLVQQSSLCDRTLPERPNIWGRNRGMQAVHVWDVARGEVVFTPFEQWRQSLRYVSFHPQDASRVRLHDPATPSIDGIWSVPEAKLIGTVTRTAPWPIE